MILKTSKVAACFAVLGLPTAVGAQEAPQARVEMVLVQEDGQTIAMSVSVAEGPFVETASIMSGNSIATGAIASVAPVGKYEAEAEFDLFTSMVGP